MVKMMSEVTMEMSVTEFKAKCTKVFRDIEKQKKPVQITRRGKVIAVVQPSITKGPDPQKFLGCLHDTLTFHPGWDEPLGEDGWEACE
jgi:antitoxin (DNA-binding transcriptional repressor) of toxin-antitoxin stability system